MIFFDVTKAGSSRHRSGLTRVSSRLRDCLGAAATDVVWDDGLLFPRTRERASRRAEDWFFTTELFSDAERPGFSDFLESRHCRLGAVFHDAIPLKHPHITWPQSVARHAGYLKLLSKFDRVWAVSRASREELVGFWRWQGIANPPPVDVLALGADFNSAPRTTNAAAREPSSARRPQLLCLGIIEPRKNQLFLLEVCDALWTQGLQFELHLVGRVNPHFGPPIAARIRQLARTRPLQFHEAARDTAVAGLLATARATLLPTIAEGCGLPLLESLWAGVPCVCSDLPVLRENADGGGCVAVATNDSMAWQLALRRLITDDAWHAQLGAEASSRPLPTWAEAARTLQSTLQ